MSETLARVYNLRDIQRVVVGDEALRRAIIHIREQKETAIIAEEWELQASWHDEEKRIISALGGSGLVRYCL